MSPHEVVGVGDAENDHAFLSICGCAVAVANALPALKQHADIVTTEDHGRGAEELIKRLLDNDLRDVQAKITRHHVMLGHAAGAEVRLAAADGNLMIVGEDKIVKTSLVRRFMESLRDQSYQFCVVGGAGDFAASASAVTVGNVKRDLALDETLQLLKKPEINVALDLKDVVLAERPGYLLALLARLEQMRQQVGRPHWIVVNDADQLLATTGTPALSELSGAWRG